MVVKYKTDTFYVKEKIENQTFYMEFSNFDDNGETVYIKWFQKELIKENKYGRYYNSSNCC